jgi:hypothetical protein
MSTLSTANITSKAANTPPVIKDVNGTECGTFCRAWIKFDGSTDTINGSFNVGALIDVSAGVKTISFATAMPNANYCVITDCKSQQPNRNQFTNLGGSGEQNPTTAGFQIVSMGSTNNNVYDAVITTAAVFGD